MAAGAWVAAIEPDSIEVDDSEAEDPSLEEGEEDEVPAVENLGTGRAGATGSGTRNVVEGWGTGGTWAGALHAGACDEHVQGLWTTSAPS